MTDEMKFTEGDLVRLASLTRRADGTKYTRYRYARVVYIAGYYRPEYIIDFLDDPDERVRVEQYEIERVSSLEALALQAEA